MDISFIIPVFNQLSFTQECVASLQSTLPHPLSYEIIIVDNASTDGTRDWFSTLRAPIRGLLNEQNLGYGPACNRGAYAASGDAIAILNNDLVFLNGWLEPMLAVLRHSPRSIVGNVQLSVRTRTVDHAGITFSADGKPHHLRPPLDVLSGPAALRVPAITGACMLLRRETFHELGGFDEHYVNGYEDIDLCLRGRDAKADVFVATRSVVYHYVGSSEGRYLRESENATRFASTWASTARQLANTQPTPLEDFSETAPVPFNRLEFATLQVFHPSASGYSEPRSAVRLYRTRAWSRVRLTSCRLDDSGVPLRIDPCDFPGVVRLANIRILEQPRGPTLFRAVGADECAPLLALGGTAKLLNESPRWCTVQSTGNDPQLQLRTSSFAPALLARNDLIVEFCLRTDPGETDANQCAVDNISASSKENPCRSPS